MIEINEWLSVSETSGSGDKEITISANSSKELNDRIQSLKFKADDKQVYVNIRQKLFELSFNVDALPTFTQDVLERTTTVTSNVPWTAKSSREWITLSQTSGEEGTTNLTITVDDIVSPTDNRSGYVDFYYNDSLIATTLVRQEFNIIFEVPESIDIVSESNLSIVSNLDWYAVTDDNFYSFRPSNGSSGTTTMTFTPDNYGLESVLGSMSFYHTSGLFLKTVIVGKNIIEPFYIEAINESVTVYKETGSLQFYNNNINSWINVSNEIVIKPNEKIYFRNFNLHSPYDKSRTFIIKGKCNVGGDIRSLLGSTMTEKYAYKLFYECEGIVDASKLLLPFETLSDECFMSMFQGCSSLDKTPELPATNLSIACYKSMFAGCSVDNAPFLPSMILAEECYADMFIGNGNIKISTLPATILAKRCYSNMFNGSLIETAPELPATVLAERCYDGMFSYCEWLTTPPSLSATVLSNGCCANMFRNCIRLESSPILSANILTDDSYELMFVGCTSLNYIKMLATDIDAVDCLFGWVDEVSSTGTFVKKKGVEIPSGISGIPDGWTVVEID